MKFAASKTLKRVGASALIASTLLTATACGYTYKAPTTIIYSASDGQMANLGEKEEVQLRNIMVIASDEDSQGRILGTILNQSDKDATVTLKFPTETVTVDVEAGKEIRFEDDKNSTILKEAGANPGMTIRDVTVSSDITSDPTTFNVPVLDAALDEYAPYLPNAAEASASATATASTNH